MNIHRVKKYLAVVALLGMGACSEDFLEPTVSTSKDVATNVNTLGDLQGVMLGAYDHMNEADYYGRDYIIFADVRSDNAFSNGNSGRFVSTGQFVLQPTDAYATDTWEQIYQVIANTNIVINAQVEDNDSPEVQYVKGQAHAIRGLAYMDLLRLYGQQNSGGTLGVPIITEFNDGDIFPPRATVEQVWAQIGQDLQTAAQIMDPTLEDETSSNFRINITTGAVYALQSRYFLYVKDYINAAAAAKKVIDSQKYTIADESTFLDSWAGQGGPNSIFELAFTATDNGGNTSLYYMLQETNYGDVEMTEDLYNTYEPTDIRRELYSVNEGTIRMAGKYPSANYVDNVKIIRYEEVILNYAEALAQTGSPEALTYLNLIAESRGATPYAAATIDNILLERRKELAMEGHRFFDLMRYGKGIAEVDPRQTFVASGIPYGSSALAFPIPLNEISANPNIVQNDDY